MVGRTLSGLSQSVGHKEDGLAEAIAQGRKSRARPSYWANSKPLGLELKLSPAGEISTLTYKMS